VVAEKFGWIGTTRRETVAVALQGIVASWVRDWMPGEPGAEVISISATDFTACGTWHGVGERLFLGTHATHGEIGVTLLGASDPNHPLARHIGKDALASLCACLAGEGVGSVEVMDVPAKRTLIDERSGALAFAVEAGALEVRVHLSRERVDELAPVPLRTAHALCRRTVLVEDLTESITIEIELGELNLGDARNLHVGDVLATTTPLSSLACLNLNGRVLPAIGARLGCRDTHRAIALETIQLDT